MALLFLDTFDHYQAGDILKKWTGVGNSSSQTLTNSNTPALAFPGGGQVYSTNTSGNNAFIFKTLPSNYASVIAGGWFYIQSTLAATDHFLLLSDGANTGAVSAQLGLHGDGAGHLVLARGPGSGSAGTTLATSTNTLSVGWHHVEIKTTINNLTGTYEVRVDGSSVGWVPAATGANTRATGNNQVNGIIPTNLASGNSGIIQVKTIYIMDTSGSGLDKDFLGVCRGVALRPVAAGNYAQWSANSGANWMAVADTVADGDDSYNSSATANQIDSFVFDDLPSGSGTVFAVQHVLEARQDAGAARTVASLQRSAGADSVGGNQVLAAGYSFYLEQKSQNPATSANWSVSDVNGAEFGYKLIS